MKVNEGKWDRVLRVSIGATLVVLAAMGVVGPWGWLGVVPVLTGAIGFCPAYTLLGINTCPANRR